MLLLDFFLLFLVFLLALFHFGKFLFDQGDTLLQSTGMRVGLTVLFLSNLVELHDLTLVCLNIGHVGLGRSDACLDVGFDRALGELEGVDLILEESFFRLTLVLLYHEAKVLSLVFDDHHGAHLIRVVILFFEIILVLIFVDPIVDDLGHLLNR